MDVKLKVGIIGGTGLDNPDLLEDRKEKIVDTPFGSPSDVLILGRISGVDCVLLARHGRKHTLSPSAVNYRANIYALRAEGCTHILATTACGSLSDQYKPGDIVILDQFIDRTYRREQSFYDGTCAEFKGVCHIPMASPFCEHTRDVYIKSARELGISHHEKGTIVVVEGPRFSSRAESKMFQMWGGHVISMTPVPEAVLAAELGLCYASAALVTDFDCWKEDSEEHVSVEQVMAVVHNNSEKAIRLILLAIPELAKRQWGTIIEKKKATAASSAF